MKGKRLENCFGVLIRVWTGGAGAQWQTLPLHVQGNPLHLRKFPLHFLFCFLLSNDSYSCNQQILAWKLLIGVSLIAIINEILVNYWKSKVKGENYYHFEKINKMVKNSQKAKKNLSDLRKGPNQFKTLKSGLLWFRGVVWCPYCGCL